MFYLFQLSKKTIWQSHSLKSDSARLFSVVDDELPNSDPKNKSRFIYRFVDHNIPSVDKKSSDTNSLNVTSSPRTELDCTFKSGDYVVWLFHKYECTQDGQLLLFNFFFIFKVNSKVISMFKRLSMEASRVFSDIHLFNFGLLVLFHNIKSRT